MFADLGWVEYIFADLGWVEDIYGYDMCRFEMGMSV